MTGRRQHYAHFYGLLPLPRDERPLLVVHGNCQAEALRVLLAGDASPVRTVRVPPVHELTSEDLPHLDRLLAEVDVLVSQPVRDGYRDLPVGRRPGQLLRQGLHHPRERARELLQPPGQANRPAVVAEVALQPPRTVGVA